MSTRNITQSGIPPKTLPGATYLENNWVRNPSWLPLASIASNEQKFTGLYAVYPRVNYIALSFTTSGGAQYTVNWGDGSAPVNVNSGVQANYEYDFDDVDLANTNAPVTFNASTNRVERTNHGYVEGMTISFSSITTTTGIVSYETYYVENPTTNDFQLSRTLNGPVVTLVNNGSGIILPFKQVVVTVTPVSGNFTVANLNLKNTDIANLSNGYMTGWLDVAFAGSYTTISIGGTSPPVNNYNIQRVQILNSALANYNDLFHNLLSLQSVPTLSSNQTVTNAVRTFANCVSYTASAPGVFPSLPNTLANCANMFQNCSNMITAPFFDTRNVTVAAFMFTGCRELKNLPLYNTGNVTNMNSMFLECTSLETIPRFNTGNVTNMRQTFNNCLNLKTIPLIDTSRVTDAYWLFLGCRGLITIPTIDMANNANFEGFFANCSSLKVVPPFNTRSAQNMGGMFSACEQLVTIPLLDTGNVFNFQNFADTCRSLEIVPPLNTRGTQLNPGSFANCNNLKIVGFTDLRNLTTFQLPTLPSVGELTLDVRNVTNFVSGLSNFRSLYSAKLNNAITSVSVSGCKLNGVALNELYASLAPVGGSVTFQATPDTVTKTAHGYTEGQTVRFQTITTTTGIGINTTYYIRNPTANTFQLSTTLTGAILNLVNDGSGTIYSATITVTGNPGVASDDPTIATNKGWTVTGS